MQEKSRRGVKERDFSEQEAANIIIGLCRGLRLLHRAKPQIICRDLKPENVVFTNEGEVKLIDFDIARFYQPGNVKDTIMMGTEGYAAPNSSDLDRRMSGRIFTD